MLDEELLKKMDKIKRKEGLGNDMENLLTLNEVIKQGTYEFDEIKEFLNEIPLTIGHIEFKDKGWKLWFKFGEGDFDYGVGTYKNAKSMFTIISSLKTHNELIMNKKTNKELVKSGDIKIEGDLRKVMLFGLHHKKTANKIRKYRKEVK